VTTIAAGLALGAHTGLGAFGAEVGPPTPRISSGPQRTTVAHSATFGVDTARDATLECSLDGSGFHPCSSPVAYRRLGLGDHEFEARALSRSGAASGIASYGWTIVLPRRPPGRSAPVPRPVLITTPMPPYASPSATFSWRAPRGTRWRKATTFQCSLNRRAWRSCSAPRTYRRLRSGAHAFRVRAKLADRRSPSNSFHWMIALSVPGPPRISSGPPDPTTSPDVSFTFEAHGAAGYDCYLDETAWQPCSSPVSFVGLQPASHDFCVRGLSAEGVAGPEACDGWLQQPISGGPPPPPIPPAVSFVIGGDLPGLLFPGASGLLPLSISNPNDFDLLVSNLVVTAAAGSSRAGCDGVANLGIAQSNAALGAASLLVPAHGSVTLPAQGATAPVVTMLDLPTSQDACKGALFTLAFSGSGTRSG
jgi:hypothetical protein